MIEYESEDQRLTYRIMWLGVILIACMGIMWGIGCEMVYLITVHGSTEGIYIAVVFGIFLSALVAMWSASVLAMRAKKKWGDEMCHSVFGIDSRVFTKVEVLVLWSLITGTILGIGVWDFTLVICALIANMFDLSTFSQDYVFIDLIWWTFYLKLWMFLVSGIVEMIVGSAMAISLYTKVRDNTFCEPDALTF